MSLGDEPLHGGRKEKNPRVEVIEFFPPITKRQYAAIEFAKALLSNNNVVPNPSEWEDRVVDDVTDGGLQMADAMLAKLEKRDA